MRAGHRGIHPGANVGLDLILWLAFAATTVINGLVGFGGSDYYDYYTDETGLFTSGRVVIALGALETLVVSQKFYIVLLGLYHSIYDSLHVSKASLVVRRLLANLTISVFDSIMHLGLFVVACYETHLRNSKPPVIYYQAAPQPTMNQQTYYQPHQQQHSQQQPPPQTMMELPGNQPMGYPSHIYSQNNYYEKPGSDVHTHLYEPSAPSHPGSPAPPSMTDYSSELAAPSTKYR